MKHLNNVIEQGHRAARRRWRATQCVRSFHTAGRTPEGAEAMRVMEKGQVKRVDGGDMIGQAKLIECLSGGAA